METIVDDTEELYYWLTNKPAISEVRRLNRDTLLPWPLSVLMALVDAGVDCDLDGNAVLRQVVIERPGFIDCRIRCRRPDGTLIADLWAEPHPHYGWEYHASWRRFCPACRGRDRNPDAECTGEFC